MRLRIDLAYDGSPYVGFARQPDQVTVQGTLEDGLSRLLGTDIATVCAGRTDRGVHALAQVVHFDLPDDRSAEVERLGLATLHRRLDAFTGPTITIWSVRRVSGAFDARFSATERAYRYRLVDDSVAADPLVRHDRWHLDEPLAIAPMRVAGRHLVGEHDFASFCRAGGRHTVRQIDALRVTRPGPGTIEISLRGPAFCHQQVRSIVGCLVEVGRSRRSPSWVADVLAARDRAVAARVAPAHGLTLERVAYGRRWPAAPPLEVRRALTSGRL